MTTYHKPSTYNFTLSIISSLAGLLRLQQIYQGLKPGNESFQVEMVKRIANVTMAIDFLHTLEDLGRFNNKYIVLDCPTEMAKQILIQHVRDISLGRRTYHYLLSGLVRATFSYIYTPTLYITCKKNYIIVLYVHLCTNIFVHTLPQIHIAAVARSCIKAK